jgi:hypothetical protein
MNKSTISKLTIFAAIGLVTMAAFAAPKNGAKTGLQNDPKGSRHVDLVIALDISGSMDGLIDSARQKLWDTVNLLATAKPTPTLRVGLITYGNDSYNPEVGWVKKDSDLTTDLDSIYAKLFALRTNGGTEYVARAVHDATFDMEWTKDPQALKMIFVAGNEPATQDPKIPVAQAMKEARDRGIFVNAIYCGTDSNMEAAGWRTVASLGGGNYAAIDQDHLAVIATPMDADLARLSNELNKTYIAFGGEGGRVAAENQAAQDKNAAAMSAPAAASRAAAKASTLYDNDRWDLVDATKHGKRDVKDMKPADLPAEMRNMNADQRQKYVEQKAQERAQLQKQINELNAKREGYIANERKKTAGKGPKGFDDAFNGAVQKEAESTGFQFAH